MIKTYSVDTKHGHCGEACIDPNKFAEYKLFEPGLTKCESNDEPACANHGYANYTGTETHGLPHILTIELDFYDPTKPPVEASSEMPNLIQ